MMMPTQPGMGPPPPAAGANLMRTAPAMKESYLAARRKAAGRLLKAKGGPTFSAKVAFVKKKMPAIKKPEGFVASGLRAVGKMP